MTKLNNYLLRFLATGSIVFLASCIEDDPMPTTNPTISITAGDFDDNNEATGEAGDVVTASLTVNAEGGFNTLRITKSGGEPFDEIVETKMVGEAGPAQFTTTFTYTLVEEEEGVTVTFTVQAVDDTDDANTGSITLTVVTEEPASPDARVYSVILLEAPLEGTGGGNPTSETFFSSEDGETYSIDEVDVPEAISKTIDFGYFFGTSSGANLASPVDYAIYDLTDAGFNWSILNETEFRETTLTSEDLLITTFADIDEAFESGTAPSDPSTISGLAMGDVIAFQTDSDKDDGSKRGLILVNDLVEGNGSDGEIDLEIHIQEKAN